MKKFRSLFLLLFVFCLFFTKISFTNALKAAADIGTFPSQLPGVIIESDGAGNVCPAGNACYGTNGFDGPYSTEANQYYMHYKTSGVYDVVCVGGSNIPTNNSTLCTLDSNQFSIDIRAGLATIMEKYDDADYISTYESTSDVNKYWYMQVAIYKFLFDKGVLPESAFYRSGFPDAVGINKLVVAAKNTATKVKDYKDNGLALSINATALTFTKNNDGYYYSNEFRIQGDGTVSTPTLNNSKFKLVTTTNGYKVKIKSSDIGLGTTASVNLTVQNSDTIKYTDKYNCGQGKQDISLVAYDKKTYSNTKSISGSITKGKAQLQIAKVNKDGKYIAGAKINVKNQDGSYNETFTTTEEPIEITNLTEGTYTLTEVEAPSGYVLNITPITFIIDSDAVVTSETVTVAQINVVNDLIKTSFSKKDATTSKELPGATLQILDKDKKPILDEEGNVLYNWVSTSTPKIIEGLPVGIYYLKETIAPNGYTKTEEMVKFEVKNDGTITKVEMKNSPIVKVPNTAKTVSTPVLILSIGLLCVGIGLTGYIIYSKKTNK